jgi:20S proteasome alpha/beta subunit
MSLNDAILMAGKVIKENMEQKINKDNIEISYISSTDGRIVRITPDEIQKLIERF